MISNNFKSKAKNIAIKSFMYEMKRNNWYLGSIKSLRECLEYLNSKKKKRVVFVSVPSITRKYRFLKSTTCFCKDPYKILADMIPVKDMRMRIPKRKRKTVQEEEYEYLTNCVNSLMFLFFDRYRNIHLQYESEPEKITTLSQIGERIFVRAGKKIYGDSFQVKKEIPEPTEPIDLEKSITYSLNKIIKNNNGELVSIPGDLMEILRRLDTTSLL